VAQPHLLTDRKIKHITIRIESKRNMRIDISKQQVKKSLISNPSLCNQQYCKLLIDTSAFKSILLALFYLQDLIDNKSTSYYFEIGNYPDRGSTNNKSTWEGYMLELDHNFKKGQFSQFIMYA